MILHSCSAGNKREVLMAAILAQENWRFGEGKCIQTIAVVLRTKHNPGKGGDKKNGKFYVFLSWWECLGFLADLLVLDQEVFSLIYMFLTLNAKITHLKINFTTFAHWICNMYL